MFDLEKRICTFLVASATFIYSQGCSQNQESVQTSKCGESSFESTHPNNRDLEYAVWLLKDPEYGSTRDFIGMHIIMGRKKGDMIDDIVISQDYNGKKRYIRAKSAKIIPDYDTGVLTLELTNLSIDPFYDDRPGPGRADRFHLVLDYSRIKAQKEEVVKKDIFEGYHAKTPEEAVRLWYEAMKKKDLELYRKVIGEKSKERFARVYAQEVYNFNINIPDWIGVPLDKCYVELDMSSASEKNLEGWNDMNQVIEGASFIIYSKETKKPLRKVPLRAVFQMTDGQWHAQIGR